jgi:hypothetical protein
VTALDVKTERDQAIGLHGGVEMTVVRVFYRRPPTRRWTRFLLVPDVDQTIQELEAHAHEAAIIHAMRAASSHSRGEEMTT